jgi:hypothetical protein
MTKTSPFIFMDPAKPVAVWWPCKISVPVDSKDGDSGAREQQDLNVRFVVLPDDEVTKLLMSGGQKGLLERIVVGWDAVDEQGLPVPFERFAEISAVPYVADGILAGYRDFAGRAPTKN